MGCGLGTRVIYFLSQIANYRSLCFLPFRLPIQRQGLEAVLAVTKKTFVKITAVFSTHWLSKGTVVRTIRSCYFTLVAYFREENVCQDFPTAGLISASLDSPMYDIKYNVFTIPMLVNSSA